MEDHILVLQQRKRVLAEQAIERGGEGVASLTRGDLEALFGPASNGPGLRQGARFDGVSGDAGDEVA